MTFKEFIIHNPTYKRFQRYQNYLKYRNDLAKIILENPYGIIRHGGAFMVFSSRAEKNYQISKNRMERDGKVVTSDLSGQSLEKLYDMVDENRRWIEQCVAVNKR